MTDQFWLSDIDSLARANAPSRTMSSPAVNRGLEVVREYPYVTGSTMPVPSKNRCVWSAVLNANWSFELPWPRVSPTLRKFASRPL